MGKRRAGGPACLLVCAGKDCRGAKGFDHLEEMAKDVPHAYLLPCQGLCHGPIAGVQLDGRTYWFSHVRSKDVRKMLVRAMTTGRRPKALRALEVRKRRDAIRGAGRARPVGRRSKAGALA